uniref:Caspase-1 n=1 Tax=Artemia sinica TaxID=112780 RepID=L7QKP8_9CRUS|nr:caspase-1 [Artemia sinica]
MRHSKRGKAIIFNNKDFSPALSLRPRNGTDVDRDKLFLKLRELDFDVYCYNDLTLGEIEVVLKALSKEDHTERDTLMITVLSHGEAGILFAKDTCYKPEILWSSFTADRCPTLAGKPKLFFIQACQGDRLDSETLLTLRGNTETDSGSFSYKIPSHADFLICYSTIPGFFSWRNTTNGSWFVQALCRVLGERYRDTHLLDMMTIVNQIVAFDYESNCPGDAIMHQKKQIPCITSLLTRQVFFEPK